MELKGTDLKPRFVVLVEKILETHFEFFQAKVEEFQLNLYRLMILNCYVKYINFFFFLKKI